MMTSVPLQVSQTDKGRSLFLTQPAAAGTVLLQEQPCIAWPVRKYVSSTCASCMKYTHNVACQLHCGLCQEMFYCSEHCMALHAPSHAAVCSSFTALHSVAESISEDVDSSIRLVIEVTRLKLCDDVNFQRFMSQTSAGITLTEDEEHAARMALDIASISAPDLSLPWTREIIAKDKACGQAVMLPSSIRFEMASQAGEDEDVEMIRGFAALPMLSLANHSCMPNCCRWDNADHIMGRAATGTIFQVSETEKTLTFSFRALYDLPAGTELALSYVPILWSYEDRKEYCEDMFGFTCHCPRCLIESQYIDDEEETGEMTEKNEAVAPGMDESYISLFMMRHGCDVENCTGTLTPCSGFNAEDAERDIYICNVCLHQRRHAEFIDLVTGDEY